MADVSQYLYKSRKAGFTNPIGEYVLNNSLRENAILKKLKELTQLETYSNKDLYCEQWKKTEKELERVLMICASEEAQFFSMILKLMNAKKAIEIGVFTGYNLLNVAMALPTDGKVVGCDVSTEYVDIGKPFFAEAGVTDKIDLRIQPALKTLDELLVAGEDGTYDFIFIDADKLNYDNYYEKSLQLLRTGGLIAIDNVLWDGRVTQDSETHDETTRVLHNLNKKIHKDPRVEISLLPMSDGVYLCRKV